MSRTTELIDALVCVVERHGGPLTLREISRRMPSQPLSRLYIASEGALACRRLVQGRNAKGKHTYAPVPR